MAKAFGALPYFIVTLTHNLKILFINLVKKIGVSFSNARKFSNLVLCVRHSHETT